MAGGLTLWRTIKIIGLTNLERRKAFIMDYYPVIILLPVVSSELDRAGGGGGLWDLSMVGQSCAGIQQEQPIKIPEEQFVKALHKPCSALQSLNKGRSISAHFLNFIYFLTEVKISLVYISNHRHLKSG